MLRHILLLGLENPIRVVPHRPGHPDRAVVPEVTPDLPHDHGHAVGGEAHVHLDVKVVNGLDQPDAAHLEQVVHILPPAGKLLDHRQHQPEVAGDQLLPGLHIPRPGPAEELQALLAFQHLQLGRIDAADFHLALHNATSLARKCFKESISDGRAFIRRRGGGYFLSSDRFRWNFPPAPF